MKRSIFYLLIFFTVLFLGGCIISKSPNINDVAMTFHRKITFSMEVIPSNATYTWILDGVVISNTEKSYDYYAQAGNHIITVKAKHALGTDTQTWNIKVNSPPVAIAKINSIITLGGKAKLDGSASYDPDGKDLTYTWRILSKPLGSTSELSNDTAVSPTFIPDKEGCYDFDLVVSDGDLHSNASEVILDTFDGGFESWISFPWGVINGYGTNYTLSSDYVHGGLLSFKPEVEMMSIDNKNNLILWFQMHPIMTYVYSISAWMYRKGASSWAVHSELYVDGKLLLNGEPAPCAPHEFDGKYHILDPKDPDIWVQRTWEINAMVSRIDFVYNDLYITDDIYLDDIEINTWGD